MGPGMGTELIIKKDEKDRGGKGVLPRLGSQKMFVDPSGDVPQKVGKYNYSVKQNVRVKPPRSRVRSVWDKKKKPKIGVKKSTAQVRGTKGGRR